MLIAPIPCPCRDPEATSIELSTVCILYRLSRGTEEAERPSRRNTTSPWDTDRPKYQHLDYVVWPRKAAVFKLPFPSGPTVSVVTCV